MAQEKKRVTQKLVKATFLSMEFQSNNDQQFNLLERLWIAIDSNSV